jgi:VWFA-related protein
VSHSIHCLLVAGFVLGPLLAQEPVIKTTTRLVQVSVIAKSHDEPVGGLTQDDFKVLVDGHQQKIAFFSAVSSSDRPSAAINQPTAPNTFTNVASGGQAVNAVTVVLLDLVNTKMTDRIYAQQQMIKYLLSIPATDHVAVYSFNGRLRVLHDYTSDMADFQQKLAAANGRLVSLTNTEGHGAIDSSVDGAAFAELMGGAGSGAERDFYLRNRVLGTLNVLKFIAAHLAQVPGRKNLVWLSGGFPLTFGLEKMSNFSENFSDEMDATVRALSDASVAVYPVDARGLTTPKQFSASERAPAMTRGGRPAMPKAPTNNYQNDVHMTMQDLADRTGGRAFYNTNDLSGAIHQAVQDSTLTYTLGFYPDDEKHNREFHKLKVEVSKPHISLHYRSGYLDLAELPKDEKTRSVQVYDALWSPLDATEIGIRVQLSQALSSAAVLLGQAAPPASNAVNVAVVMDSKGIQLEPKADRHSGRVDVLMVQFNKDGSVLGKPAMESIELNMLEQTFRKFLTDGLNVKEMVNVVPGAISLRVIVRDYGSGMIGSVTIPLNGNV